MESLFTQPVRKTTLYQSILDEIREAIRTGKLKGGDQLPSEREMAKAFGTSRAAVRQSYSCYGGIRSSGSKTGKWYLLKGF